MKRVDAAGNAICSTYDLLHRELKRTYPSGTYASVTPEKHFLYDAATVNSQTMAYAKARLAEAYTCFSPCTAPYKTDIGLSYTTRGEISDVYESTPNSNGFYYHTAQSYWANRALNQLTGNIGLPTVTYGPDGEGRVNTVSASSGNPVSSTTYNAASLPTAINLGSGSGDTDAFQYDLNTNRMTQYQFTVNSTSLTGTLGWNADGTLQTQNITDGFNSPDTQNCAYQYDDVVRVASANCGPQQDSWNANGGSGISHQCGRADGDGWSVNVVQDPPGCFMQYGPYYTINSTGTYLAQWVAQVDNNDADDSTILRLDVNDATTQTQIASVNVTREQFTNALTYQTLSLPFTVTSAIAGHSFEFRMYWYCCSYVKEQSLDYASNSTASQSFSYDPFGNISKSGSPYSFQPTYSASTNRITVLGSFTPTYDADGNLTNDNIHNYAWDADGHAITVDAGLSDAVSVTYDALGRMVEQNRGGTYTQVAYSPLVKNLP